MKRIKLNRRNQRWENRAREALRATGLGDADPQDAVTDLLTYLRHYCRAEGVSFVESVKSSKMHHDAEKGRGDDLARDLDGGDTVLDEVLKSAFANAPGAPTVEAAPVAGNDVKELADRLESLGSQDIYTDAEECAETVESLQNAIDAAVRALRQVRP